MTNKQWYIVFLKNKYGLNRYMIEHYLLPNFENRSELIQWQNEMRIYFRERTGIQGGQIVAIEPSEIISVYEFRKEDGYEG